MAIRQDITKDQEWFVRTARNLDFEVLDKDPSEYSNAAPIDVSGFTMEWDLTTSNTATAEDLIPNHAVVVTGTYNADRTLNTQRVRVSVTADETDLEGDAKYYHELRVTDPGSEAVLCFGDAWLCSSPN